MATLAGNFQHKLVSQTQPGELFRTRARKTSAICVNVEAAGNSRVRVGILKWHEVEHPTYLVSEGNEPCVSYGTDWAVEPLLGDESFPQRGEEPAGSLLIGNGLTALRLDPAQGRSDFDYFHIDLVHGGRVEIRDHVVPVIRWRIWAAAEDRNRPGATPVVEFGA
jgi:hypothetical protein